MAKANGRPLGAASIAPRIRGYFIAALDKLVSKKMPLDSLIAKGLEEDLKGTLQALAKYMPQEIELNHSGEVSHTHKEQISYDILQKKRDEIVKH